MSGGGDLRGGVDAGGGGHVLGVLPREALGPGGALREAFLRVQAPWTRRGVDRWLAVVEPASGWPCFVVGAWRTDPAVDLEGTIVGVWAPEALGRFDDLFDPAPPSPGPLRGGVWHLIAVTTAPETRGTGLGKTLAGAGLEEGLRRAPGGRVVTLSPAVGLAAAAARVAGEGFEARARRVLDRVALEDGRPWMAIQRFHQGNGAALEAALFDSRADDASSGHVTLRFAYPSDGAALEAALEAYGRAVAVRRGALEAGRAAPVEGLEGAWLLGADAPALGAGPAAGG